MLFFIFSHLYNVAMLDVHIKCGQSFQHSVSNVFFYFKLELMSARDECPYVVICSTCSTPVHCSTPLTLGCLPVGGVLVVCSSSSSLWLPLPVLLLPALFLTDTINKMLQISPYVVALTNLAPLKKLC